MQKPAKLYIGRSIGLDTNADFGEKQSYLRAHLEAMQGLLRG